MPTRREKTEGAGVSPPPPRTCPSHRSERGLIAEAARSRGQPRELNPLRVHGRVESVGNSKAVPLLAEAGTAFAFLGYRFLRLPFISRPST